MGGVTSVYYAYAEVFFLIGDNYEKYFVIYNNRLKISIN